MVKYLYSNPNVVQTYTHNIPLIGECMYHPFYSQVIKSSRLHALKNGKVREEGKKLGKNIVNVDVHTCMCAGMAYINLKYYHFL